MYRLSFVVIGGLDLDIFHRLFSFVFGGDFVCWCGQCGEVSSFLLVV